MTVDKPFVFIIGFNKCGTRTLHEFFEKNDFRCIKWDRGRLAVRMLLNSIEGRKVLDGYADKYQVFGDMIFTNDRICIEANSLFRQLATDYPGSYFIYNTRDLDKWVASRLNHKQGKFVERYKKVLQTDDVEVVKRRWIDARTGFERELQEFFRDSTRLLVLDIESENAAQRIGKFLGLDMDPSAWQWIGRTPRSKRVAKARS